MGPNCFRRYFSWMGCLLHCQHINSSFH